MSEPVPPEFDEVLGRYGLAVAGGWAPRRADGGFSGADIWQVATAAGPLCVRRWPREHPTAPQLRGIHDVLQTVVAAGCRFVPNPLRAADGNTVTLHAGRLWEVTPWMPGVPDESPQLSDARREAVWKALASFHRGTMQSGAVPRNSSAGLKERLRKLDQAVEIGVPQLQQAAIPPGWEALAARRDEFIPLFTAAVRSVRPPLVVAAGVAVAVIPCIRDIRREHVLFTGDEVTGWVDFGALDYETPAADVARVLVEFCDEERATEPSLFAAYEAACSGTPLAPCSLLLVDAFVRAATLLSPWTWLRWILLDGYDFPDRAAVLARFDRVLARLRRLAESA